MGGICPFFTQKLILMGYLYLKKQAFLPLDYQVAFFLKPYPVKGFV